MTFLAKNSTTALLMFILPAATMNVYLAPVLVIVTLVILPWAVLHYFRAGKWIDSDLARATEHD